MKRFVLAAVVCLAACAGSDIRPDQCSAAYDLGQRDGIMGLTRQDSLYEPACARQGARLDLAQYREGWLEGHFLYEHRMPHTE